MLGDPITVTQSSVDYVFRRIGVGTSGADYRTDDGLFGLSIAHSTSGKGQQARNSHRIRLDFNEIGSDPFVGDLNRRYDGSLTVVANTPFPLNASSLSVADFTSHMDKLAKALGSASSWDVMARVIRGES